MGELNYGQCGYPTLYSEAKGTDTPVTIKTVLMIKTVILLDSCIQLINARKDRVLKDIAKDLSDV